MWLEILFPFSCNVEITTTNQEEHFKRLQANCQMEMKSIFFVEVSPIGPPFKVIFSSFINVNMNI
jgi:hypothetical protein